MVRPSRRAVVIAASFALTFASVAPSAHAARGDHDDDTDEPSGGLLGLIDITNLLGGLGLPALGGLPTVEGIGLPALDGVGLPALGGIGLPALEGVGLPALGGIGLPALGGIGLPSIGLPDPSTGLGLNINVLIQVGLSGAITTL